MMTTEPVACLDTRDVPVAGTVVVADCVCVIVWNESVPTGALSIAVSVGGGAISAVCDCTSIVTPANTSEIAVPIAPNTAMTISAKKKNRPTRRLRFGGTPGMCL